MSDDLLREASDPTTPGERLRFLLRHADREAVCVAAAGNPNLPVDELRRWLLEGEAVAEDRPLWMPCCLAAWHNPSVSALLMSEPSPEYREAARHALRSMLYGEPWPRDMTDHLSFEGYVAQLAVLRLGDTMPGLDEVRRFAHHLASLFGLPWPAP